MNLKLSIFSNAGTVPLEIAIQKNFFKEFEGPIKSFTETVLRAVAFTKDPANTETVAAALCQHLGNLNSDTAIDVAQSLQGPQSIIVDRLPVSRSGVGTVLRLREKYTSLKLGLTPEDLCDPRVTFIP